MNMLIIKDEEVQRLIRNAEENVISLETMQKLNKGEPIPICGDDDKFTMNVLPYYRVVLSYEEHPMGICRHASISSSISKNPPEDVIRIICTELGFINPLEECITWDEDFGVDTILAKNIVEPLNGKWPDNQIKVKNMGKKFIN